MQGQINLFFLQKTQKMKLKITLISILALLIGSSSYASHLMGGQITAKQINGLQYQVKLVAYRDTLGIPMYSTATFNYSDNASSWKISSIKPHGGAVVLINGVEEYTYTDTINFPAAGSYTVKWDECCRNAAIINMSNPGAESFYLNTIVAVDSVSSNSTPVFLNPPVTLAQLNNLFSYNPLPFDADGDSLAWSLVTPLSFSSLNPVPVAGYVAPHASVTQPFSLNAITGEITWLPDMMGNFVSSFLVEEYRGGVKIGEIRRDMQILVINDTTNQQRAKLTTTGWPTNSAGNFNFTLPASSSFNLTVVAMDANNDALTLSANGAPFAFTTNPAYFSTASGIGIASCDISWTPTVDQIKNAAYTIAFRISEKHGVHTYVSDKSIQFSVTNPLNVSSLSNSFKSGTIFPNPANSSFYVPFNLEKSGNVKVEVMNAQGQLVKVLSEKVMKEGQNIVLVTDSNLSKGIYSISIWLDGTKRSTQKLVIVE